MKKLSIFQILLLVFFGACAIAGILVFSIAVGGGTSNSVGAVTIWGTFDSGVMRAVLRQAAESNGNLSQVTYEQKDPDTYEEELTQALASGTGPDLFFLRQDHATKDTAKIAVIPSTSLTEAQFNGTFIDAAKPFYTADGALGVPLFTDPLVLYWNKDMLASAGYAQPPKYWDELYDMAQKITQRDDAGQITKSAIAFGEYANVNNAKDILATLILQAGGTITAFDQGNKLIPNLVPKNNASAQAAQSALRFYTEFADPSKADYSWNASLPSAQQAFAAGDVALYVGYASEEGEIARANSNLNFAPAPLPQIRATAGSLDTAHVYALAAARAGRNPAAAISAAYLVASADVAKALSVAYGLPAARRDILDSVANGKEPAAATNDPLYAKMAIISKSWVDPDPEKTTDIFRDMINKTVSGASLPSEAIQRADQELGHILGL